MQEVTNEMRLRAAKVARELADKVKAGLRFGAFKLFNYDGQPHCALGHLIFKAGLAEQFGCTDNANYYSILEQIAPKSVCNIWQSNDEASPGALTKALNRFAEVAEQTLSQIEAQPDKEAVA